MRIVIDMQGAQAGNRDRGIGRYTYSLCRAIIEHRAQHEVVLALNGVFPETVQPIRDTFRGVLPPENIQVWQAPGPTDYNNPSNSWRREAAELTREAFLASLKPSVVLVCSFFEGFGDDAVTSIGSLSQKLPTAVILYDLIPLLNPNPYLEDQRFAEWYKSKLRQLRRASLLLSISESSRAEGIEHLRLSEDSIVNVSTAVGGQFQVQEVAHERQAALRSKYGIDRPYLMYTGGIDFRKNIEGLIRAYAQLSSNLREAHQLAIVCSILPRDRSRMESLAREHGLKRNELVLTGYIPEEDLVDLYLLCKAFVFPSRHEGFGLPALEAMSCGRAVIGSNTSSLPEVIGYEEALFDPYDEHAIARTINRVLTDDAFRGRLEQHGLRQSQRFSWDASGKRAIRALERLNSRFSGAAIEMGLTRPRLAYISPLPPEKSGISFYSAELIPSLAHHYDIELVVDQSEVVLDSSSINCNVRSVDWFRSHHAEFDRVLYHFGNSKFHRHMFGLVKEAPGVVVLHDFYLSGVVAEMDGFGHTPGAWARELYEGHGYAALSSRYRAADTADVVWRFPCNHSVLQHAQGVIVHSENSRRLAKEWYGQGSGDDWEVIPHLRTQKSIGPSERSAARNALGINQSAFVVCSFGLLGPSKLNHRLLDAWLASSLAADEECFLFFVGENDNGDYGGKLQDTIKRSGRKVRITITGWTDTSVFHQYLAAADIGVQLRALSRGETSGTVLDCMGYGLPTIVNANGSLKDIEEEGIWKLPDAFNDEQLRDALITLWRNAELRDQLGDHAQHIIRTQHDPSICANKYAAAIERFHAEPASPVPALISGIAKLEYAPIQIEAWTALANSIDASVQPPVRQRQLLVDISELVQRDAKSGIQRVVRSIINQWLLSPPHHYRVEPVYATADLSGYRYARQYVLQYLGCPNDVFCDEPISYRAGDTFLGLDFQPSVVPAQEVYYKAMRRKGVSVQFVVYDLLLLKLSHCFPEGAPELVEKWLRVVAQSDGVVCISRAVADEMAAWLSMSGIEQNRYPKLSWFHLGADIEHSAPTRGLPENAASILASLRTHMSFLVVGTIEPRKGHQQCLEAFDQLWKKGRDINLVIVGKQGWQIETLVERLRSHPESGKRLFWLEAVSDEYLERIYTSSTCLIVASQGEGFGLPLIEAAQNELPIIARDIPVFREVASEHAYYFKGEAAEELADAIDRWILLYTEQSHPTSDAMPWLTWRESAEQLAEIVLGGSTSALIGPAATNIAYSQPDIEPNQLI